MSLLGHLVPEWRPEDAATRALAYIFDPHVSPGIAVAFVALLGSTTGFPRFRLGRVEHDPRQEEDSLPDLTIRDTAGKPRILVETTFWKGVDDAQPVAYLEGLPDDAPSALVFIAPRTRIPGLWGELKARCLIGRRVDLRDESYTDETAWARAADRVLLVMSWTHLLNALRFAAYVPAVAQDIRQLQGLTTRMESEAFLPLADEEVKDARLVRRMMGYGRLVEQITRRLVEDGVVVAKNWNAGSYKTGRMVNYPMRVHGKFDMRFGIELEAWRDFEMTPLWWVLQSSDSFNVHGQWRRIKRLLDGVRSSGDSLYIPIRLRTRVEEARVIDGALAQMRDVADRLLDASRSDA